MVYCTYSLKKDEVGKIQLETDLSSLREHLSRCHYFIIEKPHGPEGKMTQPLNYIHRLLLYSHKYKYK